MENVITNKMTNYEGMFTTTDPTKIDLLLNKILHNPSSALIIEPILNEYWIFYYGGFTFPNEKDLEINHFPNTLSNKEDIETTQDAAGGWKFDIIKMDDPADFFNDTLAILNKIRNKNSIKIATEQPDAKRKFYVYYKS